MSDSLPPPGQDDDEIQALAALVAENLAEGESAEEIAQQLVDSGWELDDAWTFVGTIQHQVDDVQERAAGGSEGSSWMYWIGGILLIKLLSYLFR